MRRHRETRNDTEVYDDFADYVRDHVRDRRNPQLALREFSLLPPPSFTHMEIPLEGVQEAHTSLFAAIEKFRPKTLLKTREEITTGGQIFVAYVPFENYYDDEPLEKTTKSFGGGGGATRYKMEFIIVGYLLLLIVALWKTTWDQWTHLFS